MGLNKFSKISVGRFGRGVVALAVMTSLSACDETTKLGDFFKKKPASADAVTRARTPDTARKPQKTVERDVEAPEIFQVSDAGLWDGRPSLGGVWVAYPEVKEPERVLIRNEANGKFVVGALFRRERENPGPRLQVSSDAAESLGMLAGQPMKLNVTALRREEIAAEAPQQDEPAAEALDAPAEIAATTLDPIAGATAAIDKAEAAAGAPEKLVPASAAAEPAAKPTARPTPKASALSKPFIQIGIFSVEKNANNTATAMRQAGMIPTVRKQSIKGKPFWRVLVGPANTGSERSALLKKIKASGFTDAYYVTN